MRLAWLFDVDGTLIRSYGTARESFSAGLRAVIGVVDGLDDFPFAGGMDPQLLRAIAARHGRTLSAEESVRFWEIARARTVASLAEGRGRVLPGVTELLAAIGREPGWLLGLLTGNGGEMARVKLEHFGLREMFAFGHFGDEAETRDDLARQAVLEIRERWDVPPERCVVVGDTEHDIRCARAAGARALAVATGTRTRADLEPLAPDLLLDDLSDTGRVIEWGRSLADSVPSC